MSNTALIIKETGTVEKAELPEESGSLSFLQKAVEGWVQCVPLVGEFDGVTLWVNEEGKLGNFGINRLATMVWEQCYGQTDLIMGNAVLTADDDQGNMVGLTEEQMEKLLALVQK